MVGTDAASLDEPPTDITPGCPAASFPVFRLCILQTGTRKRVNFYLYNQEKESISAPQNGKNALLEAGVGSEKLGGLPKKRGGRRHACAAASEGWRGEGEGGWPPKAAPRPRRGAHRAGWSLGGEGRGEGGVRGKGRRWRAKRATLGGSSASEARARTP